MRMEQNIKPTKTKENIANIINLILAWTTWLSWMILSPHFLPLAWVCILSLLINLIFLQTLSGVVHESAHRNFIQGHKQANDFIGNWFAANMFLYGLSSYRSGHLAHHRTKIFLIPEDGETAPNMAKKVDFSGFFHDIFGMTAIKMFLFRTGENKGFDASASKSDSSWPKLIIYFLTLWSTVSIFGSPLMPILYIITMTTIYPLSNRIRLWGTHADIVNKNGLYQSKVARNVKSPIWERIFFGNRMMMYHYEHHSAPQLTFRECEKQAYQRVTDDLNISAPSYFFCVKQLFKTNRVTNTAQTKISNVDAK